MEQKNNLCMSCMEKLDVDGNCPSCKHNSFTYDVGTFLPAKTTVGKRYIIGNRKTNNYESVLYIGYDTSTKSKVFIREFFPENMAVREGKVVNPNKDSLVTYKSYLAEFFDLYRSLVKMKTIKQLIHVTDLFYENGTAYAVYKYFDAITFEEYLKRSGGFIPWEKLKDLLPSIMTTLSLFHNDHKYHLGISTTTIFITENEEIKLAGFSIVEERMHGTSLVPELFSGYSAPEQYSDKENVGIGTDIYSICAVIYRALTGVVLPEAHLRKENDTVLDCNDIVESINPLISSAIRKGISVKKEDRFRSISELVGTLFTESITPLIHEKKGSTISFTKVPTSKKQEKIVEYKNKLSLVIYSSVVSVLFVATLSVLIFTSLANANDLSAQSQTLAGESTTTEMKMDSETLGSGSEVQSEVYSNEFPVAALNAENLNIEVTDDEFILPSFVGYSYESLQNLREVNEILEITTSMEYSDEYEQGVVIDQGIAEGSRIVIGSTINLVVSRGSSNVEVPSFEGLTKKEYLDLLDSMNIKYDVEYSQLYGTATDTILNVSIDPGKEFDVTGNKTLIVYLAQDMAIYSNE